MDIKQLSDRGLSFVKKYKFVVLIFIVGIVLMLMPANGNKEIKTTSTTQHNTQFLDPTTNLQRLLSEIHGAGEVQIMLTLAAGEKTVYQTDQDQDHNENSGSVQVETVILSDSNRNEYGLIQQILAPEYRGAVIVCEGADDPAVKYAIMEAVKNMTGLGFDRISVLKMK